MNHKPLISIITPSYNQSDYLEKSMLSVLNQNYPNIEYLVVDGNSTDGSQEIIRKYEDRLDWWISEKDNGQADAFNKGLQYVNGKYVGWLNSDDLFLEGTISEAVDILESDPELAFVFGDVEAINAKGEITNIMKYGNWNLIDLMQFKIIGQPAVFMRTNLLKTVGGLDMSFHYLLDHHLWLKLAARGPIKYSGKLWAAARFHAEAKNVAHASEFGQEAYRLVAWMEKNPETNQIFLSEHKKILAGAHRMNARYLLDGGQYSDARDAYWQGLKLNFFTILPEWHRFLFAIFAPLGLIKLKDIYLRLRFWMNRPDLRGKK
ncbi:MAG: glycosyltransferase family 2 protein [Anaerolineaceae bacterium]|nr:glycosyltransferase family 2 protein [Anaerolineaceae bacterium]